jgi:hypothetical protein
MLTVNLALKGIPEEKVRFRTCYVINEGPRLCELALSEVIPYALTTLRRKFSFEAANPRHEHEYRLFETVKLPAMLVGRENARGAPIADFLRGHHIAPKFIRVGNIQGDGTRRRHRDEAALGQKCCGNKLATGLISAWPLRCQCLINALSSISVPVRLCASEFSHNESLKRGMLLMTGPKTGDKSRARRVRQRDSPASKRHAKPGDERKPRSCPVKCIGMFRIKARCIPVDRKVNE